MEVYKHKNNNRYYIVCRTTKDRVYYVEWNGSNLRYWDSSIVLFHVFKKYLEPVSKLKEILIRYEIQQFLEKGI